MLGVLQARGVAVEPPAPLPSARELLLSSFERYLLVERGLAAGTVAGYLAHAERFLAGLPADGLSEISAAEVSQAVLRVSASVAAATAQNFISGLRAFLGYLFLESFVGVDLSQAALAVRRRRSPLPRGLARSEIQAILNSCDRRSALGRRDYAIVPAGAAGTQTPGQQVRWRPIVRRRGGKIHKSRPGSRSGNLITVEPPGEAASHKTRCA